MNDPDRGRAAAPAAQRRARATATATRPRASTAAWTSCRRRSCASDSRHLAAWTERRRALAAIYSRRAADAGVGACRRSSPTPHAVLPPVRGPPSRGATRSMAALKERGVRHAHPLPDPAPPAAGVRARSADSAGDFPEAERAAASPCCRCPLPGDDGRPGRTCCGGGGATRCVAAHRLTSPCTWSRRFGDARQPRDLPAAWPRVPHCCAREDDALALDESLFLAVAAERGRLRLARRWLLAGAGPLRSVTAGGRDRGRLRRSRCSRSAAACAAPLPRPRGAIESAPALPLAVALALDARRPSTWWADATPASTSRPWASSAAPGGIEVHGPGRAVDPRGGRCTSSTGNPGAPGLHLWRASPGSRCEPSRARARVPRVLPSVPGVRRATCSSRWASAALATPPVFGVLGTLGAFFALRRLFGRRTGSARARCCSRSTSCRSGRCATPCRSRSRSS